MLHLPAMTALWFLPFVAPLCAATVYCDLKLMRIPNWITDSLGLVYILVGLIAMPSWGEYGWHLLHLPIGLGIGFLLYMGGVMGAGDAKFIAAAAPFVAKGDVMVLAVVFCANLLAGFVTHRLVKYTALRRLAPDWESWHVGFKFPMGFCLGITLVIYLGLAVVFGQ